MRTSAVALTAMLLAGAAAFPATASTYETLTGNIVAIKPNGSFVLHDRTTIVPDKKVAITGTPEVGGAATLTYSADENGYSLYTLAFAKAPAAEGVAKP